MTDKNINKIDGEELLAIVREAGLDVEEQKAFYKCTYGGHDHARIYVARTKKVGRVDATFALNREGVITLTAEEAKEQRLGKIRSQLDFAQSADVVKEALGKLCEALKVVPVPEPKPTKKATKRAKPAEETEAQGEEAPTEEAPTLSKEDRRELVKKAAEAARRAAEATA